MCKLYSMGLPYLIITVSNRALSFQLLGYALGIFLVCLKLYQFAPENPK